MPEFIVMDKEFETLGAIPIFTALIWIRRYEKSGYFELYVTKEYFNMLNRGRYLYREDADELGVIDEVRYRHRAGVIEAYAKGFFAEKLLADRVIEKTVTLSGSVEMAMRTLVQGLAITPAVSGRVIRHLCLGKVSGIAETLEMQATGDNLSEKLYEMGNTFGISHRIRYDYPTNNLFFEVWKGKDRRDTQQENSWAIFSDSFYNIRNVDYYRDDSSYRNFAYVAGAGEGPDRVIITVDQRKPGEEPKEIWVDARFMQPQDEKGNAIPMDTYKAQLALKGAEALADYRKVETVSSDIDPNANLVYKKDFDLGDYCNYVNEEIGIMTDERITEIIETHEGASMDLTVTLGNGWCTTVRQMIKREG